MTAEVAQQVTSCGELSVGDQIEAWHNGKLFHRGEVIRTVAATDLFWILDERTGTRRLIDAEALVIRRVAVPGARGRLRRSLRFGAGRSSGGDGRRWSRARRRDGRRRRLRRPRVPASHVPLFQAPSLAGL